jgi:hypothetical protein
MGQPELARLGLYYPFIQFRDDSWLKLAALYWDRIGRIVPPGYELQDSDTVLRLQGELGFVANLAPSYAAMDGVSREFLELLADRGPELSDLYGIRGPAGINPAPEEGRGGVGAPICRSRSSPYRRRGVTRGGARLRVARNGRCRWTRRWCLAPILSLPTFTRAGR